MLDVWSINTGRSKVLLEVDECGDDCDGYVKTVAVESVNSQPFPLRLAVSLS